MKVVYIAGPYRAYKKDGGFDIDKMFDRTMEMRKVLRKYLEKGYAAIAPLTNHFLLDSATLEDEFWIAACKELVSRCDAIVMMQGYENSLGSKAELAYAISLGKEVIYDATDN